MCEVKVAFDAWALSSLRDGYHNVYRNPVSVSEVHGSYTDQRKRKGPANGSLQVLSDKDSNLD
jgi:hypothetical protein